MATAKLYLLLEEVFEFLPAALPVHLDLSDTTSEVIRAR